MSSQAQTLLARLRGIDRMRVDELAGLVLLIEIELRLWLGTSTAHRPSAAIAGGVLAMAVAVRRRWTLAGVLVAVAILTALAVLGAPLNHHEPGGVVAALLLFYA